ncbi:MAG: lamin tail domain-containing protein [Flavobacteriales bacterium]|nr:lamin tail domain-containing protein [Flavobacteriales bacterium]
MSLFLRPSLILLLLLSLFDFASGQILTFEFSALAGGEATAASNGNDAGLQASSISRGAGLTASGNAGRFNATNWAVTSIANAVSGDKYMEFTITPNGGQQFSVSSIYIQLQRSGTGPSVVALRSSVDSYASNLDGVKTITDNTNTQNFTFTFAQANSSSAVTYRFYMYAETTTGTGGIGDGTGNDIVVNGSVTAASGNPTVNLSASANTGSEAASTYFILTGTASAAVTGPQTVDVALSGTGLTNGDFRVDPDGPGATPPSAITFPYTVTIADGQTSTDLILMVFDDALNEGLETATFTIGNESAGITLGSTTTQDFAITDNDSPVIVASPTSLAGFSTPEGTPSASQTFTLSGDNLSGNLSIAALSGFEYSLDNSTFTSTLTVPVSGGNVTGEPRTIYVRLTGASQGPFSGNAAVSGGGATTQNVALNGTVTPPPAAPCTELFISEYHEAASGNEKYIELYNPTSSSITLTGIYSLVGYTNGSGTVSSTLALSGSIPGYGVVYASHSSAALVSGAMASDASVMGFNGNDVIALRKSGVNIDVIGTIGSSANFAADVYLRRLATVSAPATTYNASEWSSGAANNVTNIGSYINDCTVANPVVTLGINTATGTETASTSITLTATADAAVAGDQTVQVTIAGTGVSSADFSVTFPTDITILDGQTTGTLTFTINNDVAVEGDETATFTIGSPSSGITVGIPSSQDLTIADDDNVTSTESVVASVGGEAVSISSLTNGTITNNTQGTQVWQFRLYDGNGSIDDADSKPTIYEQFTIRQSGGNTVPVWNNAIDNVKFFLGASATPIPGSFLISASTISFTPTTPITVADGTAPAAMSMRITLDNPLAANSDGLHFGFSLVPADVTIETDVLMSSQLGTFTAMSNGAMNVIDIDATLQFISAPTTVGLGDAFTITVSAIDANGNIDQDDTTPITLAQNTGSGTFTGGSTSNLVNGTYTWTGLTYDVEETFQVIASGGSYSAITANINVVDADYQLFDDFNRSDTYNIGIPSSGGSTTWTETEAGDGTKVRVFSNMLMLDNCIASDPSGSSGSTTTERVTFNVETYFETVFDDAGGTLNWLFNMRTNNSNLSGFAGSAYGMAFILGCDQADFTAAGSDGYAVVVGNGGTTDYIKLVRFANGLSSDANLTDMVSSDVDIDANHASVRVSFDPCSGTWTLYARNDGASFVAPNLDSPAFSGPFTATNTAHTALDLRHFGALWKHNSSCVGNDTYFDNFNIPNSGSASTTAKEWNGSVNADWNEANNWGPCPGVPTQTDDVIIPNVATQPIISATPVAYCKDLTVNAGAELTINSGQFLNVYGNVVNNGVTDLGAGTLSLEGAGTATVTGAVNIANFHTSKTSTLNGTVTVSNEARSESGGALNANGNLIIQSGAQLLHGTGTTGGGGSVSGNITVRRQGSASTTVYNYWSSPVVGGTLPGGNQYYYDSSLGTHSNADDTPADLGWQSFSGNMITGQGYASTGGGLANFVGVPNNGTLPYAVTTSAQPMNSLVGGTRFNLVGNPYPSAISANTFINANGPSGTGRIAGMLYFWDDDNSGGSGYATNDYATWTTIGSIGGGGNTPLGSIATGQGFKVDAQTNGDVTFTNAMRGGSNSQFFRLAEEDDTMDRLWLSLSGNGLLNQTLVAFRDDATDLRDVMYDAHKIRGNANISLASVQAGEVFAIAAYPMVIQPRTVPLQTYVSQQGNYTFEADSVDGFSGTDVYLQDLQSGQSYMLAQGATVSLQVGPQDEFNRFQLWFSPELVTGLSANTTGGTRIISSEMGLQVLMSADVSTNGELRLHNAMGQLLLSQNVRVDVGRSSLLDVSGLPAGIYIAAFRSSQGMVNAKVVLR